MCILILIITFHIQYYHRSSCATARLFSRLRNFVAVKSLVPWPLFTPSLLPVEFISRESRLLWSNDKQFRLYSLISIEFNTQHFSVSFSFDTDHRWCGRWNSLVFFVLFWLLPRRQMQDNQKCNLTKLGKKGLWSGQRWETWDQPFLLLLLFIPSPSYYYS